MTMKTYAFEHTEHALQSKRDLCLQQKYCKIYQLMAAGEWFNTQT